MRCKTVKITVALRPSYYGSLTHKAGFASPLHDNVVRERHPRGRAIVRPFDRNSASSAIDDGHLAINFQGESGWN